MTELVQLDLSKVDVQLLADIENLLDDAVRKLQHLLAESRIGTLLTVATDQERSKLEA
jgi:hypothetical protein